MFERYTERARRGIFHARYEALCRGSREIEPKDIALGLTRDAHQPGCPFAKLHEDADGLRRLIGTEPTLHGPPTCRQLPLSSTSKKALAYADLEARRDRRYAIGSDHLLRGVLRAGDETAAKLAGVGYTLSAMREASKEAHRLSPDVAAPFWWRFKLYRRRLLLGTVSIVLIAAVLYLRSQN